jgi:hypothetical protein
MWDDNNKIFYYQVAIGNGNAKTTSDHDIWRLPQADDTYGLYISISLHLSPTGIR